MKESKSYQFEIGEFKCTLYKDFHFTYRIQDYFNNIEPETAITALRAYDISKDPIPSPYVALLIEHEKTKILVDTGLGIRPEPLKFKGHQFVYDGQLIPILRKNNLLKDIDQVILTHLHPDHAGGLFDDSENIYFPNAEIIIHEDEWNYWNNDYQLGNSPVFDVTIREQVIPLKNRDLKLVNSREGEIYPGIQLHHIPGHTPGQIAVQVSSGGEHLLYISDAWLHPLHIEHLDWTTVFDLDHMQAKRSRIKLLEMAYDQSMLVQSFHFDFPGLGRIDKVKDGWKWVRQMQE